MARPGPRFTLYLRCPSCGHLENCDAVRAVARLQEIKMLRRDSQPDEELLRELVSAAAPRLTCVQCGQTGLFEDVSASQDDASWDDVDWGGGRLCVDCRRPIPKARLEALPQTKLCTDCQQAQERGRDQRDEEYCPRCGAIMVLRQALGGGLARYQPWCPHCRRTGG